MTPLDYASLMVRARYGDGCRLVMDRATDEGSGHNIATYWCLLESRNVSTVLMVMSYLTKDDIVRLHRHMSGNGPVIVVMVHDDARGLVGSLPDTLCSDVVHAAEIPLLHRASLLSPQHRRASKGETDDLAAIGIRVDMLPRMELRDPMARWHGFSAGDVIRCSSRDGVHYRIVGHL